MYNSDADGSDNLLGFGQLAVVVSVTGFLFALFTGNREESRVGMAVGFAALLVAVVFLGGHRLYRAQQLALGQALAPSRGASIAALFLLLCGAIGLGVTFGATVLSWFGLSSYSSPEDPRIAGIAAATALAGCLVWPGKKIRVLSVVPQAVAWAGLLIVSTVFSSESQAIGPRALAAAGAGAVFFLGGSYSAWRVGRL